MSSGPHIKSNWVLSSSGLLSKSQTSYHRTQELHAVLVQYPFSVCNLCPSRTKPPDHPGWTLSFQISMHLYVTAARLLLSSCLPFSKAFHLDSTEGVLCASIVCTLLYTLLYPSVCYSASSDRQRLQEMNLKCKKIIYHCIIHMAYKDK